MCCCRHSPELAQAVIDSGALDSLVTCLEEFDPGVKEAATWCLGYIAGHNTELAQQVVDAGEGPQPLQEPLGMTQTECRAECDVCSTPPRPPHLMTSPSSILLSTRSPGVNVLGGC